MGLWDDYSPTANWATNRPVVADGAPATAEQWRVTQEDIYDRLEHLKEGGSTVRALERHWPFIGLTFNHAEWNVSSALSCLEQDTAGANQFVWLALDLPQGCTLTEVTAWVRGIAHAALPASMPQLSVWRRQITTVPGAPSSLVSQTDTSASVVAYDADHPITASLSHFVNRESYQYWARLSGESGANSTNDLRVYGISASFTTLGQMDGGS